MEDIKIYNKKKVFENEISWIVSDDIRKFTEMAVELLPEYFFETPASSTGKYHPSYSLGDGGLVRHTKAATAIANNLLVLEQYGCFSQDEKDMAIAAIILHDGLKSGLEKQTYTLAKHPLLIAEYLSGNKDLMSLMKQPDVFLGLLRTHMGEFNRDFKTNEEILPKPQSPLEKFVHLCDYLASRKYLIFEFEDYYKPENFVSQEIPEMIQKIIKVCKEKISSGIDKNILYGLIADINGGNKNPNSIDKVEVAKEVLKKLSES